MTLEKRYEKLTELLGLVFDYVKDINKKDCKFVNLSIGGMKFKIRSIGDIKDNIFVFEGTPNKYVESDLNKYEIDIRKLVEEGKDIKITMIYKNGILELHFIIDDPEDDVVKLNYVDLYEEMFKVGLNIQLSDLPFDWNPEEFIYYINKLILSL